MWWCSRFGKGLLFADWVFALNILPVAIELVTFVLNRHKRFLAYSLK